MAKDQLSWDQILLVEQSGQSGQSGQSERDGHSERPSMGRDFGGRDFGGRDFGGRASELAQGQTTDRPFSKKNWSKLSFPLASPHPLSSGGTSVALSGDSAIKSSNGSLETTSAVSPVSYEEAEAALDEETVGALSEPQVISVSELNKNIRDLLEGRFPLIWLRGEISNFKAHTSGHFYFNLKDSKAQIAAVMFRGFNSHLRFRPEDGMEVLVRGKVTVYEPRGNYQIFCELMEPVGAGALQKAYEQLKAKLQGEGLFDQARKRPLPSLPKHIAIVTSPTGAAIRDMLNVLGRRFKGANITIVPCKVQGDQAPAEIVHAIGLVNRLPDVDVMIVGRGGGSIEDLWAFNDERVARAIAAARVPVVSAVGHEVDFTIADFVADLRAPTPSAAAELVVKNAADLIDRIGRLARSAKVAILRALNSSRQETHALSRRLVDPQRRLQDASQRCDELLYRLEGSVRRSLAARQMTVRLLEQKLGTPEARIERDREIVLGLDVRLKIAVRSFATRKRESLIKSMALLDSLSPLKVLDRGYSMVVCDGKIVTDATTLSPDQNIIVRMCKGSIEARVTRRI